MSFFIKDNCTGLFVVLLVMLSWVGVVDSFAVSYIDESLLSAIASFGIAKAFNATISIVSSVTLDIFIAQVQIGEFFAPLMDMVEDFSAVMKYSIASLLIQKIMVEIFQTIYFKVFITLSGCVFYISYYFAPRYKEITFKIFAFAVLCKFAIAVVAIASSMISTVFVDDMVDKQNKALESFPVSDKEFDQTFDLSREIKQKIQQDMDVLNIEMREQDREISLLKIDRQGLVNEFEAIEKRIALLTENDSFIDKLVRESNEVKDLKIKSALVKDEINQLTYDLESLEEEREDSSKKYVDLEEEYNNDTLTTAQRIKNGYYQVTTAAKDKIIRFAEELNQAMENFLQLMALYIFKVLIIPLLFLIGMYKAGKAFWGIRFEFMENELEKNKKKQ